MADSGTADTATIDRLTGETTELLQAMIRNRCVNDGTITSGNEDVTARLLFDELAVPGVEQELFEPTPGRTSLISRLPGTDPTAPKLCLMGHTDVVPVSPDGWERDPFGGELVGDPNDPSSEVWGRGAVDMLNLTSSMAVAFRHLAATNRRYPGDIIYFAVADEEAGGAHGAEVLLEQQWEHVGAEYVLTEFGGMGHATDSGRTLMVTTAEKGLAWRRIRVQGQPGHGSAPLGADNALIKAAEVVRRLSEYRPAAKLDELWTARVDSMGLPEEMRTRLLDPGAVMDAIMQLPKPVRATAHSCSHTTFSPNVAHGGVKTNVIPDVVEIEVDIRTVPGETSEDVDAHLHAALGDLMDHVEVEVLQESQPTSSPASGPLWDALTDSMHLVFPEAAIIPSLVTGGTDARFYRQRGSVAYGAGLLSAEIDTGEFWKRFHGHNERIDLLSLRLTTKLWLDVVDRLWA
ncbi:MAG: M20/M25/M40 family metallo-hydrolase [Actinomycetota bacterium]